MSHQLQVLITVDVEYTGIKESIEGPNGQENSLKTMNCLVGKQSFGLPYILKVLLSNNLLGTFFVEPLSSHCFGLEKLQEIVKSIKKHKQQIELHAHPAWLYFNDHQNYSDELNAYSVKDQTNIIHQAKEILNNLGCQISAFRAGGFSANNDTFTALKNNNILCSSNYNLSTSNTSQINLDHPINSPTFFDNVFEFPITNYKIRDIRNFLRYTKKPMQICCSSYSTMVKVLKMAHKQNIGAVTLILHNFEFINRNDRLWMESPLIANHKIIRNFEKLCLFLSKNRDQFPTVSFTSFNRNQMFKNTKSAYFPQINNIYLPQ